MSNNVNKYELLKQARQNLKSYAAAMKSEIIDYDTEPIIFDDGFILHKKPKSKRFAVLEFKLKSTKEQIRLLLIELRRLPVSIISPFVSVKLSTLRLILKSKAKTKLRRFITEIILSITEPTKAIDTQVFNC